MKAKMAFSILLIVGVLIISKLFENYLEVERKDESKIHLEIEIDTPINGSITYLKMSEAWKGTMLIQLSNGQKLSISKNTRNYIYGKTEMIFLLKEGDSINKAVGSDSIFIFRQKREFYFRLGQSLNKK